MIEYIGQSEKQGMIIALSQIRASKLLKDEGYNIGNHKIYDIEDIYNISMMFGDHVTNVLAQANEVFIDYVGIDKYPDIEEYINIDEYTDDDFIIEMKLTHKDINQARKIIANDKDKLNTYTYLVNNLLYVDTDIMMEESYYEVMLPDNCDKPITIIMTDYMFIDLYFIEHYLRLKKFCKKVVEDDTTN